VSFQPFAMKLLRSLVLLSGLVGCSRSHAEDARPLSAPAAPPSAISSAAASPGASQGSGAAAPQPGASSALAKGPSQTVPQTAAKSTTTRFAVIGDFGADTPDEAAVAKLVHSWNPDFVITTGDDNYPLGEASTIDPHIGKYYAEFIGGYHGAYGPGSPIN